MRKNKSTWPFVDAPDIADQFLEARGDPHSLTNTESPELQTPDATSVSENAAAQISNEIDHADALDRHADRWQDERNKLAPTPRLDLEPQGIANNPRSLQEEYIARRGEWERQRDQIDAHYHAAHEDLRTTGPTLSDAFDTAAEPESFEEDLDTLGLTSDADISHSR